MSSQFSSTRLPLHCLVIGGGVAGSCCAIRLREHGVSVLLVEKATFPRNKVCGCCIGGAGLELLRSLGLESKVKQAGVDVDRWVGSLGGQRVEIPLPSGVAISRETLDPLLLNAAQAAGADVRIPCRAIVRDMNHQRVRVALRDRANDDVLHSFDTVVVAGGLNVGGLSEFLPFVEEPHGPFGISWMAKCAESAGSSVRAREAPEALEALEAPEHHVIYMACEDDGYVGLVQLENGSVDIAAALKSGADAATVGSPRERVLAILKRSRFPNWQFHDESHCLTTPPLRRARHPGTGRLLAIGDSAGYSEPFTGEGMTWAMQTGIAAADLIAANAADLRVESVGDRWRAELPTLIRRNKLACRAVTSLLRSSVARRAVGRTLAQWPSLAKPMIRHLSHGP